jgi:hypothetical protein
LPGHLIISLAAVRVWSRLWLDSLMLMGHGGAAGSADSERDHPSRSTHHFAYARRGLKLPASSAAEARMPSRAGGAVGPDGGRLIPRAERDALLFPNATTRARGAPELDLSGTSDGPVWQAPASRRMDRGEWRSVNSMEQRLWSGGGRPLQRRFRVATAPAGAPMVG